MVVTPTAAGLILFAAAVPYLIAGAVLLVQKYRRDRDVAALSGQLIPGELLHFEPLRSCSDEKIEDLACRIKLLELRQEEMRKQLNRKKAGVQG